MPILAAECSPRSIVIGLREAGHDVLWAREACPGATDAQIAALARGQGRILLTGGKDFGEIGIRSAATLPGIVLLRFPPTAAGLVDRVVRLFALAADELEGRLVVPTPDRARLPP